LATDRQARMVVALRLDGERGRLGSYAVSQFGRFRYVAERGVTGLPDEPPHLLPVIRTVNADYRCDVSSAAGVEQLQGVHLVPSASHFWPAPQPAHLIDAGSRVLWAWSGQWVVDA